MVNIGIIGVGIIGKSHIESYSKIPGVNLVAVADIDETEARRVAELYHIPFVYTDFRELLKRDDIVAVDVCLHNNYHSTVTIAALEAGKHVYCEKPIAGTYVDGKNMVEAAKTLGQKLHIQLAMLYDNETKAAKKLIEGGKLGKIYHARSTGFRRRGRPFVDGYATPSFVKKEVAGGGALYDMGVYHISQLLYLLGNPEIERVTGKTYQEMDMHAGRRQSSGFNVEELGLGFVRFKDGSSLDIIEAWAAHLDQLESSTILGSDGGIRLYPFGYFTNFLDMEMNATFNLGAAEYRKSQLEGNTDSYKSSQHHWVAALEGTVELLPTAEIALRTMQIQEGIYLSEKLGREVTADEIGSLSTSTAISV